MEQYLKRITHTKLLIKLVKKKLVHTKQHQEKPTQLHHKLMKQLLIIQFQSVFMQAIGNYILQVSSMIALIPQPIMQLLQLVMMLLVTGRSETRGDLHGEIRDTFGFKAETLVVF